MPTIINFLPEGFQQKLQKCRVIRLGGIVMGAVLIGVLGVMGAKRVQLSRIEAEREKVEAEYNEAAKQIDQFNSLQTKKEELLKKARMAASLLERTPRSYVLACLTKALPKFTSLSRLEMQTKIERVSTSEDGKARSRRGNKPSDENTREIRRILFTVEGLAPTDVEVGEYIGRLSASELFQNVDLILSEKFEYGEGVTLRRFVIGFELCPHVMGEGGTGPLQFSGPLPRETVQAKGI